METIGLMIPCHGIIILFQKGLQKKAEETQICQMFPLEKVGLIGGPLNVEDDQMQDFKVVEWVKSELKKSHEKPFFIACGFYRPHLPWYVPKKYFDIYPIEELSLIHI